MSRLGRDVGLNFAGLALPVVIALVAVPVILAGAGVERLGFLTVAWAAIGYLGFLDFGLSRAIARRVAAASGDAETLAGEVALMFRFGRILFWSGAVGATLISLLVPAVWLFGAGSERLPASEIERAWVVLLYTLPAILAANVWRGAMEGRSAFLPVNVYRVLLGIWTYGAPIIALIWTQSLAWLVGAVAIGRWLSAWLHYRWCRHHLPASPHPRPGHGRELVAALKEGAWMTVSNVVGPIIVLLDRFVIAGIAGLAAAASYSIPQEIALRMLLLPAAVAVSVFPRFAAAISGSRGVSAENLPGRAARMTLGLMIPASLAMIVVAEPLLQLWLGPDIAKDGAYVLQILALSVLINAPASIAFILLQARGYARWSAWLHLIELPVTAIVLLLAVRRFGIEGAAWVWLLRIALDTVAMFVLARRLQPDIVSGRLVIGLVCASAGALVLIAASDAGGVITRSALALLLVAVSLVITFEKREFLSLCSTLRSLLRRQ